MQCGSNRATILAMTPSRSRVAVGAAFLTQGLVFISLTTRLPSVAREWDLGELGLSLILLLVVLLAGAGSVGAEQLARRRDSATLLRAGLLLMAAAVPVVALAPAFGVFVGAIGTYGFALGLVDATINMQGVALEHRYGRPLLPSFHGLWTLGGVIGAGITLATSHWSWSTVGWLALVPLGVSFGSFLRRDHGIVDVGASVVPWRPIVLVGIGMVLFYMVDTAAATWGPTYLDGTFAAPHGLVALATFPYLIASGLVRLVGDQLVASLGPRPVLRVGALVACASLAVVVFAPAWQVAVLGFALLGAGASVIAPLSFSAAARLAGDDDLDAASRHARVDTVIARFNQFNYLGALLGSVLTGVVGAGNLRIGFAVPMVLILGILPLARFFDPEPVQASVGPPGA